jgi:autotransporter-associated beta strand protein
MKPSFRFLPALSPKAKRQLRASSLGGAFASSALTLMVSSSPLLGASLYWDVNGATAGFSTVVGAWNGTNNFWNTDSAGGAGTLSAVPTSADDLFIQEATTNTGSITVSGDTKNASSITFAANVGPTTTLTGGTINIGGTGAFSGIRQQSTGANTINSALQLNSGNTAFEFSNSSTGLLTIGGVTGTATSGNVTQNLTIGSSSSGGITFGGIIADVSGSATKVALTVNNTSTGVTTLSGANTYTGLTTVSAGTLAYGANNVIGTGDVTVSGTGILNLGSSRTDSVGTVTLSGTGQITGTGTSTLTSTGSFEMQSGSVSAILAGSVALNKTTAGTVTLSGAGNYTGQTFINEGTLLFGASNVLSAAALTISSTGILDLGANQSDSVGIVTLQGGEIRGTGTSTLTTTGSFEMQSGSVSAILAGNANLNKTTAGTLTLSGANTHLGTTTVSDGTLRYGASNVIGTGNVTVNGATAILDLGANQSDSVGVVTLQGGGQIIGTGTSTLTSTGNFQMQSGSVSAILGGIYGLIKTTDGTVTLSGANTYNGTTSVTAGTLLYGASNVIASGVTVSGTGILDLGANQSDTVGTVLLQDSGQIIGTNGSTLSSTGTFEMQSGSASAIFSGSAVLNKTTAGTVTLSGANTYTGSTNVSTGTLLYGASNVIGSGAVNVTGGILDLGFNQSDTVGLVFLQNGGQINGTGTSTLTSTGGFAMHSGSVSAILAGSVDLSKSTAATVTLSAANTYTGTTAITGGTLLYGISDAIGTGNVTVNGATAILDLGANQSDTVGVVTLQGGGQIIGTGTSTLTSTGVFTMLSGSVSAILAGAVPLNKTTAGTVTLSGANTYTGLTTVSAGTLAYGASNVIGTGAVTVSATGILDLGANQSDSVGTVILSGNGAQINGTGTSTLTSTATFDMRNGSVSAILAGAVPLNKTTSGTVTLSGANTYTGETTISGNSNGTLVINGDNSGATGAITITLGTLQLGSGGTTGKLSTSSAIVNNATLRINRSDAVAQGTDFSGAAITGTGALVKLGDGTTTLSAANTFTGTTTVSGGKVALTNPLALQNSAYVTTGSNGTTIGMDVSDPGALDSGKLTLGGLAGAVDLAGAFTAGFTGSVTNLTLNPQTGKSNTYSGVIANGAMTLTKTGAGTQTLSGTNTYTGTTTINAGILTVTNGSAIADTGAVVLANVSDATFSVGTSETIGSLQGGGTTGGNVSIASDQTLTVAETGSQTFAGVISNSGSLTKTAAGTLTLTGANTYTGGTAINGGTLALGSAGALGSSGTISFGGGTLRYSASNTTDYSARFSNAASQQYSIDTNSQSVTLASVLTSTGGSFTKLGAGTLTLSGASTYSGATTVSEGKLVVNGSISTSTTIVSSGATLGGSGTVGALTINSGGFVTPGNSPGILTVNGNYSQAGEYTAEIADTNAGSGYDQINVLGTVDITSGSLVASFSGSYAQNDLLFILLNDDTDAINGTFAGYAQGATFASYGYMDWQISYSADSGNGTFTGGNDIAIMAIPEPSSCTVAGIGLAMLLGRRSRSRKNDNNA